MQESRKLVLGGIENGEQLEIPIEITTRHILICGATGTGKTVTLQTLVEEFSRNGVSVLLSDFKGDLSGLLEAGSGTDPVAERLRVLGAKEREFSPNPVCFWDIYGKQGLPFRVAVSEFGPQLFTQLLDLSEAQQAALFAIFEFADDQGLLLLDLKDLESCVEWALQADKPLEQTYGQHSRATLGALQRKLSVLSRELDGHLFGEPSVELGDLLARDFSGRGVIHLLQGKSLLQFPRVYASALLWLLSELFERLPEVGDAAPPSLALVFDEAHLVFRYADKPLLEKLEIVVKLIRSKGVSVVFVTQHPLDLPESILRQIGNRFIHGLRAFTPKELDLVRKLSQSFRHQSDTDLQEVLTRLRVGEAVVSFLDKKGTPSIAAPYLLFPPRSRIGELPDSRIQESVVRSPLHSRYQMAVDRESAHELLSKRIKERLSAVEEEKTEPRRNSNRQSAGEAFIKSVLRSIGSYIGRQIGRGILGSMRF